MRDDRYLFSSRWAACFFHREKRIVPAFSGMKREESMRRYRESGSEGSGLPEGMELLHAIEME